jgi:hypothetical protein
MRCFCELPHLFRTHLRFTGDLGCRRQAGNGGKIAEKVAIDLRADITKSGMWIVGLDVRR